MRLPAALIFGLLAAATGPAQAGAQERGLSPAELDHLTAEVAAQLRCPVCRNQSVLESSSGLAREMQSVIRDRLASGETPEEVRQYFVGRYGEWILLKPEPRGINLLVYVLPAAALLAGGLLLYYRLRRWTAAGQPGPRAEPAQPGARTEGTVPPPGIRPAVTVGPGRDHGLSEDEEEWIRDQIGSLR